MQKAMAKVRSVLGKDAVLISSGKVDGRTEVLAAVDYDPEQLESQIAQFKAGSARTAEAEHDDFLFELMGEEVDKNSEKAPSLMDMQEELGKLRKLFEGELAQLAWRDSGNRQPNRMALLTRLETVGISRVLGRKLVEKVLPCADLELGWKKVLKLLSRAIKLPDQDLLDEGGVIAMLGPTGVGKTTTAAKIAAQFAARHGRHQVAFVTTDALRIGGSDQLVSLGSALGIPVQVATNRDELERTLESFSGRKLVVIDTAGMSQRSTDLVTQFEALAAESASIRPYLVLSATTQELVINETIDAFSDFNLAGAIVTKLDECGSIGAALSGLVRHRLPIAFVGNGQRIPEDLEPASATVFLRKLLQSFHESRNIKSASASKAQRIVANA